ncbi:cupin domain-containing protein [Aspergillus melleus]|uniref:cupin domain-containing protein n=1 Tax=Aspergillus melleus TaxID=138277 RepID=UPI001E8DCBA8|nr:uncharacterized protein LDX57_011771 [Aspergillus melleus]KAH8434133.1 hypothetical protein LDX57_011771 [Aspergillus melleus]
MSTNPSEKKPYSNPLPQIHRFIATHDTTGKAIYSTSLPERMQFWQVSDDPTMPVGFFLGHTVSIFPVPLANDQDLTDYKTTFARSQDSGLVKRGGIVMRYVDYPPGCRSPMHRTVSLDYGFVLVGELDCLLDDGEVRTVRPGDVVVQRGTMHQWVNRSETEWARMVYVLIDATAAEAGGVSMEEDLGGMKGVPESH